MELKGLVILDEETMENLKDQVRQEVIDEIKQDGNYSSEIEEYLNDCNFISYIKMINCTIDNVVSKMDKKDVHFESDRKAYQQILAIKSILEI